MDGILNPEINHIGRRHYRKIATTLNLTATQPNSISNIEELSDADESDFEEMGHEIIELSKDVESDDVGLFVTLKIPTYFHRFIIGSQHSKQKSLEEEFRCQLKFPTPNSNDSRVLVRASSRFNLLSACRRLLWNVTDVRSNCRPTHFICLPVNTPTIQESLKSFRQTVLELTTNDTAGEFSNVDDSLFHSTCTMHLTISTLVLADEGEIETACNLLKQFCDSKAGQELLTGGPLRLTFQSLDFMNDDPTAVHVLYTKPVPNFDSKRLQQISNALAHLFSENNLTSSEYFRPDNCVKLHLTVMNSRHRMESTNADCRIPFNVQGILKEFGNYCFGRDQLLNVFHLSDRLNTDPNTKFYKCCSQIIMNPDSVAFVKMNE